MAKITTAAQLADKAIEVAKKYKTLYIMGCFGAPMTSANKSRYTKNHSYNKQTERTAMINAATADTFGFDCVCLIKGLLWGWNGDKSKTYGGATYAINGVPDIGADAMIKVCKELSTDFTKIEIGEAVWTDGHIGIYVGDGLAVECTPIWKNCVQLTACNRNKTGYNRRDWKKHGKLPYVTYTGKAESETKKENTNTGTANNNGAAASLNFKIGDVVKFNGSVHYANANAVSGPKCKPGKAKVTDIYKAGKHQLHLIAVSGGGSTVYGWVDAADVSGQAATAWTPKVGDRVKCNTGVTKFSNGAKMASWVTTATLYVRAVENGGKVLLVSTEKTKAEYTGRVNASDVHKI